MQHSSLRFQRVSFALSMPFLFSSRNPLRVLQIQSSPTLEAGQWFQSGWNTAQTLNNGIVRGGRVLYMRSG